MGSESSTSDHSSLMAVMLSTIAIIMIAAGGASPYSDVASLTAPYPHLPSSGLGFCLLRDGYRNVSNIDISPSVVNQMNNMQRTDKHTDNGHTQGGQDVDCTFI